jgi:hypothetical protein
MVSKDHFTTFPIKCQVASMGCGRNVTKDNLFLRSGRKLDLRSYDLKAKNMAIAAIPIPMKVAHTKVDDSQPL